MTSVVDALGKAVAAAPVVEPWETPRGLDRTNALPPLPLSAFPPSVGDYARAVAAHAQVDTTLVGAAVLAVASAAATGRYLVQTPWGVPEELALYVVASAGSGERKSSVLSSVIRPLREIEREWIEDGKARVREAAIEIELLDQRRKDAMGGESPAAEVRDIDEKREQLAKVTVPSLLIDDATPEALGGLLAANTASAAISAEGAFLAALCGRYSSGVPNLDLACKAYSGEPATVHRRSREPESIERPLLVIGQFVQPKILDGILAEPRVVEQGLAARFSILRAVEQRQTWTFTDVPPDLQSSWEAILRRLTVDRSDATPEGSGSVRSVNRQSVPVFQVAEDAAARFQEYGERHADRVNAGRFRSIASWAARHPARVLRIAALVELMAGESMTISATSIEGAIAIGDVLTAHADATLVASASKADAETLRAWLAQTGAESFTRRDAQRARFQEDGGRLDDGLGRLVTAGYLRRHRGEPGPQGGRPPSDTYAVNPRWDRSAGRLA